MTVTPPGNPFAGITPTPEWDNTLRAFTVIAQIKASFIATDSTYREKVECPCCRQMSVKAERDGDHLGMLCLSDSCHFMYME